MKCDIVIDRNMLNDWIIALYLTITCIASIISVVVYIPNVSAIIAVVLTLVGVLVNLKSRLSKNSLLFYFANMLLLLFSMTYTEYSVRYFSFFAVFGTSALMLSGISTRVKYILNNILLIYIVYVCIYLLYIRHGMDAQDIGTAQMGVAYSMVLGSIVSFGLLLYPKIIIGNAILKRCMALFIFFATVYIILFETVTRGAILAILSGVLLLVASKMPNRMVLSIIGLLSIVIVLFCYCNFSTPFDDILALSRGSDIRALDKLSRFAETGDISNGRDVLYTDAIRLISSRPLFGYGVGYFEDIYGIYPHNIILQILCELGIVGCCVIYAPVIWRCLKKYRRTSIGYKLLLLILFISNVTMLLFSNSYWLTPSMWYVYFTLLSNDNLEYGF